MHKSFEVLFKSSYFILSLLSFNIFFAQYPFITYCSYIIAGFGAVLLVFHLMNAKEYLNAGVYILFSFVCSYILGAVNTCEYGITDNIKAVIWMCIQYFLVFAFSKVQDNKAERKLLFVILTVYTSVCSVVSLYMMAVDWAVYRPLEGNLLLGGFIDNRLWGCYVDPTYGAILSLAAIIVAVYWFLIIGKEKKKLKAVLCLSVFFNFLYICYSDSRTSLLAISASVFTLVIIWCTKKTGFIKSFALSLCLVLAVFAVLYGTKWITTTVKVEITKISAQRAGLSEEETERQMDLARIGRIDEQIGEGQDVSNNRFKVWGNAVEMFRQHPVFGISFRNIDKYARDNIPETYAGYWSMHNFFFDVLVSQGIVGVLILFLFMAWTIWTLIKKYQSLSSYREFAFLMAMIAAVFASMLTYSEAFYMNTGGAFMFWYVLGYLVNFKEDKLTEKSAEAFL